jgi:alpha-glucosidase
VSEPWWRDAVVYQVYPRSFQDSDGDGVGDLRGIRARLEHIRRLGADALWLSPVYPSPLADFGYDVSDHSAIDPVFGSLRDFDDLVTAAHGRGLRLLMDLVPCHTSIEHPWFRQHPDWYVWADGDAPPNNWLATFGGPAWTLDPHSERWYLHSFYPEQPDLDWRQPEVREAFSEVIAFWRSRGVDGFRVDAIDRLVKDPGLRDDPPARTPFALPLPEEYARLEHLHSTNSPDIALALAAIRAAAGCAALVGEVYLPTTGLAPYLPHLDLAFCFELLHAPFRAPALRAVIEAALAVPGIAWVLSNHDFPRLATRLGSGRERLAAMLLLTLPGPAFVYQGDEIGMTDGPGGDPPLDRQGRDGCRHPMQWESGPGGGFSTGRPWLAPVDPQRRSVAAQEGDRGSLLWLYRDLIALRRSLGPDMEFLDAPDDVLAYRRGDRVVLLNLGERPAACPVPSQVELATSSEANAGAIAPWAGAVLLV